MQYAECRVPEDTAYLIVLGDLHIGDKCFTKNSQKKLKGYIDWVKERPNARVFLNGDLLNCATRTSKSNPLEQNLTLQDQEKKVIDYLFPIKSQIIGAIDGNHEQRILEFAGYSPTYSVCRELNIPYLGASAVVKFMVGTRDKGKGRTNISQSYIGYFHHTTGGGNSAGGKLNRVDKLRLLFGNADFYCGSHNHMLGVAVTEIPCCDKWGKRIYILRQFIIDCGGFLEWNNSYAERRQLPPMRIGAPRIRLDGSKHSKDIHVSL